MAIAFEAAPYYEDQSEWTADEFYYLHRYIHKMFFYHNKRMAEIESIDINKLTERTKVLMYCVIRYYRLDFLFEKNNLLEVHCTARAGDPIHAYQNTSHSLGTILFKASTIDEMIEITSNIERYYDVQVG
mgnify:CR=1 FL=1